MAIARAKGHTILVSKLTTVDVEGLASDVAGFFGRQERVQVRELLRQPDTPNRYPGQVWVSDVGSRNNVVDDDVVGREFYGKRPGHAYGSHFRPAHV